MMIGSSDGRTAQGVPREGGMSDRIATGEAAAADGDGEPPSPGGILLLDRRRPGSAAAGIEVDLEEMVRLSSRLEEAVRRPLEVTVALLDDAGMDALHRTHSGVAGTTDVLSFPDEDAGCGATVAGDLAIGVEVAAREAKSRGRTLEAELMLYLVHGLLHLLGERDDEDAARIRMVAAQDRLLDALGLPGTEDGEPAA